MDDKLLLETLKRLEKNSNEHTQTLASLCTDMKSLVGNGQPGRIKMLEDRVDSVTKYRYIFGGAVIVLAGLLHFVVDFLMILTR